MNKGQAGGISAPIGATAAAARATERIPAGPPTPDHADAGAEARDDVPEIAALLLNIFAEQGDPKALTVARLADLLEATDPATWSQWNGHTNRLAMVGRTLKSELGKAGLNIPKTRLDAVPGRPTAYRLADIRRALS